MDLSQVSTDMRLTIVDAVVHQHSLGAQSTGLGSVKADSVRQLL